MDALTTRRIRVLDGLHFSFKLLEHHHANMYGACAAIPSDNTRIIPALASCWGFIDVMHRLRELAQSVPGLGGRRIELREFLSSTSLAERYRHYIQHLRSELAKADPNPSPVWGSLSWVDPDDVQLSHTVMIGARLPQTTYSGAVFDRQECRWVSRVCLGVESTSFNFDPMFESAAKFDKFVVPWILSQDGEKLTVTNEFQIVSTRIVITKGKQLTR